MLELYAAYWDVDDMMEFNEALIAHLVSVVTDGGTDLQHGESTISFARPFARIGYLEGIAKYSDGKYGASGCSTRRAATILANWAAAFADARSRAG